MIRVEPLKQTSIANVLDYWLFLGRTVHQSNGEQLGEHETPNTKKASAHMVVV